MEEQRVARGVQNWECFCDPSLRKGSCSEQRAPLHITFFVVCFPPLWTCSGNMSYVGNVHLGWGDGSVSDVLGKQKNLYSDPQHPYKKHCGDSRICGAWWIAPLDNWRAPISVNGERWRRTPAADHRPLHATVSHIHLHTNRCVHTTHTHTSEREFAAQNT